MFKIKLTVLFMLLSVFGLAQKIILNSNLNLQLLGSQYTKGYSEKPNVDFNYKSVQLVPTIGFDLNIKNKNNWHVFSFDWSTVGVRFKVFNKFKTNSTIGFNYFKTSTTFDYPLFGYHIKNDINFLNRGLLSKKVKFYKSIGFAYAFNLSKTYYNIPEYNSRSLYVTGNTTYYFYNYKTLRVGNGMFLKASLGFNYLNKMGRKKASFDFYINKGLKQMIYTNINYGYGYNLDPSRQTNVLNQIIRSRGTTFGFKFGVPITIKK